MTQAIVLLHGWGLSSAVWAPLQAALDPRLNVRPLDLPGHGNADPAGPTLESWSDALLAQIPENSLLVGWSLGAQLALHLARHHPDRIARLALISATPRFVQADDWQAAMPADTLADFRRSFDLEPTSTQRRFIALQGLGDARRREVVNGLGRAATPPGEARKAALADGLGLLASIDLRSAVPQIRQPVRLLHGAGDTLMPVAAAEWLADTLPDGRLSIFADSGHAPFLSRPQDCASLIEGFARD